MLPRPPCVVWPRQVVALVEDEQAEAVAPVFDVDIGRIVGRNRDRLQVVVAAAHAARWTRRTPATVRRTTG